MGSSQRSSPPGTDSGPLSRSRVSLAALFAHLLTPVAMQVARQYGLVDRPDGKLKRHAEPVPYLGGAAVYLAFVVALGVTYSFSREVLALLLAGTMVVLLGLVDDIGAISPRAKFLGQGLAVLVLMKAGITIQIVWLPWYVSWPLTFVWLIGITNAINLVDIMDGLAAGVSLIVALSLLAVALINGNHQIAILTATLAGALAGFLRYNFQPARIYLGDTGSLFIGLEPRGAGDDRALHRAQQHRGARPPGDPRGADLRHALRDVHPAPARGLDVPRQPRPRRAAAAPLAALGAPDRAGELRHRGAARGRRRGGHAPGPARRAAACSAPWAPWGCSSPGGSNASTWVCDGPTCLR